MHEHDSIEDIVIEDPQKIFPSITVEARQHSESGLLDSILRIPYVTLNHSGLWDCRLKSTQAKSINVLVISERTKYCMARETQNNKGSYSWPKTIRGKIVKLPCSDESLNNIYAIFKCNDNGNWENLNTTMCPYIRESTRIFEQFSKVNLTISKGSILESARHLKNLTVAADFGVSDKFRDPMDVVFITRTITNYLSLLNSGEEKELGSLLLDIISQIMKLPIQLLIQAQELDKSCTSLVEAAEFATAYTPAQQSHKMNLALEYFKIDTYNYSGITCAWFMDDTADNLKTFKCNVINKAQDLINFVYHDKYIEASIQFPSTLFPPMLPVTQQPVGHTQKLLVSVFGNSNFFQSKMHNNTQKITSAIIGAKLYGNNGNIVSVNLTDPIFIILRGAPYHNDLSIPRPLWWDSALNNGYGDWSTNACHSQHLQNGMLVFACYKLGYYGLVQNTKYLNDFQNNENAGAKYRLSPIPIYIGTFLLFLCLWINVITYSVYGQFIQMGRRIKHALVNTWLALSLLSFIFAVGIYQTEDFRICQLFGISIHYLSLSVLLWICVSVSNMYKRVSRNDRVSLPSDELPVTAIPKEKKPILGLYLVGWGIGLIICGISGAVNLREYSSYYYCFIKSGPGLSAIYVPAAILLFFLSILFLCIRFHLRNREISGHISEGTQAVDLDLLDSNTITNTLSNNNQQNDMASISTPTSSLDSNIDQEHSPRTQLKAYIIVLFLYLVTWTSAGISVLKPFSEIIMYEEEIFSILYCITATIFGVFILFFYGIARSDVRYVWSSLNCLKCCCGPSNDYYNNCNKQKQRQRFNSKILIDSNNLNSVAYHTTATISRSNSQNSKNRPIQAVGGAVFKNTNTLRTESPSGFIKTTNTNNMNLLMLHRQQFVHNSIMMGSNASAITGTDTNNVADIFYNPNQSHVARKFFRKQKRLQKQNNIDIIQRQRHENYDMNSEISFASGPKTSSLFSTGSKVNNTNIHVENPMFTKERHQRQFLNPNILSDSCNESELFIDICEEGLRTLKNTNKMSNVANIYTNVPETIQPQHEVVTMRADEKYSIQHVEEEKDDDDVDDGDDEGDVTELLINDKNDLNNPNEERSVLDVPHYVNSRNIVIESNLVSCEAIDKDKLAMNTIGLPEVSVASHSKGMCDDLILNLDKDDEYISPSLELSDHPVRQIVHHNHESPFTSLPYKIISKSCEYLGGASGCDDDDHRYLETQTKSISCNNLHTENFQGILMNDGEINQGAMAMARSLQSSPILFSPSLCDITDLPSPTSSIKKQQMLHHDTDDHITLDNTPNFSLFNSTLSSVGNGRSMMTSSPTNFSDINYQNSEISIRSQDLYAPQPDNDLNIILAARDSLHFEISDLEDEIDLDEAYNCSRDYLLRPNEEEEDDDEEDDRHGNHEEQDLLNESQSSIDELYQQIKRNDNAVPVASNSSGNTGNFKRTARYKKDDRYFNENDDDSSQCSVVVSYTEQDEDDESTPNTSSHTIEGNDISVFMNKQR